MDSQITLVQPSTKYLVEPGIPQPTPASTLLFFDKDSVLKTNISTYINDRTEIVYIIDTNSSQTRTTFSKPLNSQPFAVLHAREFLPDTITFDGQKAVKIKEWLKPSKKSSKYPITFEERGQSYTWALYLSDRPDTPIAWFQRARKLALNGKPTSLPGFLVLEPEAVDIQDIAVASFLLMERKVIHDADVALIRGAQGAAQFPG
ncbi:hypothetical protein ONZ45_g8657 [Pleurotus djamor]|nr:hypothetical protein ONZ45_g8657 [Pleurotus djamor]